MQNKKRPGPPPSTKTASIAIRVNPEVRDYVFEWAEAEHRSMSSLIDLILADAIAKRRAANGDGSKPATRSKRR